jgi:hypothetical protein
MVHQTTNTSENPYSLESSQDSLLQNKQSDTQESQCTKSDKNIDLTRLKTKQPRKTIPFWAKDPNILLNQKYVFEFFPVEGMTFSQKLNAITRLVIVMTTFSFLYTQSTRLIAIGAMSILAIFLLHFAYQKEKGAREGLGAGRMTNDPSLPSLGPQHAIMSGQSDFTMSPEQFSNTFDQSTPDNPLSNVLIPDYLYDVDKKPAPPSFTREGYDNILENAKKMVEDQNPGQPDIADKLFGDLGDEIDFEKSLQPFYSTANTTIPNDQRAFAEFCYGDMTSAKEGNMLALGRNNPRWINGSN